MIRIIKLEELAMAAFAVFLYSQLHESWTLFFALILTPDLSMLGYLLNAKTGAYAYNIVHHKGIAILVYGLGLYFQHPTAQLAGIILFTHSSIDRVFGYGLKYNDSFNHTHLGIIGKK